MNKRKRKAQGVLVYLVLFSVSLMALLVTDFLPKTTDGFNNHFNICVNRIPGVYASYNPTSEQWQGAETQMENQEELLDATREDLVELYDYIDREYTEQYAENNPGEAE